MPMCLRMRMCQCKSTAGAHLHGWYVCICVTNQAGTTSCVCNPVQTCSAAKADTLLSYDTHTFRARVHLACWACQLFVQGLFMAVSLSPRLFKPCVQALLLAALMHAVVTALHGWWWWWCLGSCGLPSGTATQCLAMHSNVLGTKAQQPLFACMSACTVAAAVVDFWQTALLLLLCRRCGRW